MFNECQTRAVMAWRVVTSRNSILNGVLAGLIVSCQVLSASAADLKEAAGRVGQVIAHRGASSERPECTLAAIHRSSVWARIFPSNGERIRRQC